MGDSRGGVAKLSSRSHHSLDVLVFALVQTLVDVAEPQAVGADEGESDDKDDDVCGVLRCKDRENLDEKERHGECENLDENHDPTVLYHCLSDEFLIEWGGLLVIYCELHEQEIAYSCRECHIGKEHQQTCLASDEHWYHQKEWEYENGAIEIELGDEQFLYCVVTHHKALDVVALECHDSEKHHGSVDREVVDEPETHHSEVIVNGAEGAYQTEHQYYYVG